MHTPSDPRGRFGLLKSAPLSLAIFAASTLSTHLAQADTVNVAAQAYDIPAGPLGTSLNRFAQQAAVAIVFQPQALEGLQSPGLKGTFATQDGFDRLLQGSGYRAVKGAQGYALQAIATGSSGTMELGPTEVTATQLGNVTEGTGSYTPGTIATSTRLILTPKQTPQSVSVVTRQHMDDFGLNNVDDVMRHTPGITVSAFDTERSNYYARGFSINNFQYDGIPSTARNVAYSAGNTLSDMAIYDRVEVLKGATGLLTGAGSLGATINLVRKKPTADFQGHATLGAGSWDNYRSELDVSGPMTDSGNVRGRAVAAYQDKRSFMDRYSRKSPTY
ncbi:outer membrane receptor for ferric coprogen and ferric-rhodotorulic acid [Pseudomonas sp. W3I7]|nr:outer membrane receptor for ferric coprogen and ferric-rhodotorulic acid [Pseudomonas sp. W3I7]